MKNIVLKSLIILGACSFNLSALTPQHLATDYKLDEHYSLVPNTAKNNQNVSDYYESECGKNPTVVEFFSYACHGCLAAEPSFESYIKSKPKNVIFKRVPVVFNSGWDIVAKIYYTNDQLGVNDELHSKTFSWVKNTLSANKPITADSVKDYISTMLAEPGLGEKLKSKFTVEEYLEVFKSPTVNRDYEKANRYMRAYDIRSTPTVIINNKYKVTLEKNTYDDLIKIINKLTTENTVC